MHTKIHYQNFETGEFTDEKDRTAEETISLIENFPWAAQREHLAVSLDNPGVIIEGPNNDYLQLAPYYQGKFVLHYIDPRHHLHTRGLDRLQDAYPMIRAFFETQTPDLTGFRQEMTLLQQITPHYLSQDFHYTLNRWRILGASALLLLPAFFIVLFTIVASKTPQAIFFDLPAVFIFLYGTALLINHCLIHKGRVLIVSRGQEAFAFGPVDNPKKFYKQDITDIVIYGNRGRGGGYGALAKVEINFQNGTSFEVSALVIPPETLVAKFPGIAQSQDRMIFPFINRDVSALFE